jgi:hypothetical protein
MNAAPGQTQRPHTAPCRHGRSTARFRTLAAPSNNIRYARRSSIGTQTAAAARTAATCACERWMIRLTGKRRVPGRLTFRARTEGSCDWTHLHCPVEEEPDPAGSAPRCWPTASWRQASASQSGSGPTPRSFPCQSAGGRSTRPAARRRAARSSQSRSRRKRSTSKRSPCSATRATHWSAPRR